MGAVLQDTAIVLLMFSIGCFIWALALRPRATDVVDRVNRFC